MILIPPQNPIPPFVDIVGKYWVLKKDEHISNHSKWHGDIAYDRLFIDLPELNLMPKGSLAIDVGAFIGDTARIFLNKGFSVKAFEAQKDAFICLRHNCPESENHRCPIGDGRMVSLFKSDSGNMGGRPVQNGNEIQSRKLDDFMPEIIPPTFLKIDVEGFEPAVLDGAKKLLSSPNLKFVVIEFNPHALIRFGWTCEDISKHFYGWNHREIHRSGDEIMGNWDWVYWR